MWPFSKKKVENIKQEDKTSIEDTTLPKIRFQIAHTCGIYGNYYTVQFGMLEESTVDGCSCNYMYRDISKKFENREYADNWMRGVIKAETELGQKTAKLLYVLKGESERKHIQWLYEYVLSMIDYYSTAYVKDRSIFELMIAVQIVDMGYEIFDCLNRTEKALFGKILHQETYMEWVEKDDTFGEYEKQQGFEPLFVEDAQKQNQRQFSHIGSNTKNLLAVHWKINLNNIVI